MRRIGLFAIFLGLGAATSLYAPPPGWWTNSSTAVIDPNATASNYAPANLGQLKKMAKQAKAHMDANLLGGAGSAIDSLVADFEPRAGQGYTQQQIDAFKAANYGPINLGQLKAVAKPFYDRLIAAGYATKANLIARGFPANWQYGYPWNPETPVSENYAPANLGQLKMVFSFSLTGFDSDDDGLPDGWEDEKFDSLVDYDGTDDNDGDGLTNLQEYQQGSDPLVFNQNNIVAAPVFNPVAGTYNSGQTVSISSATAGTTIRYTIDGSTPTSNHGIAYSGPVTVSGTVTLKSIAYKSGMTDSAVTSGSYVIDTSNSGVGATPSNFTVMPTSPTSAVLSWTNNSTTGTVIEMSLNRGLGSSWTTLATVAANVSSYTLTDIDPYALMIVFRAKAPSTSGSSSASTPEALLYVVPENQVMTLDFYHGEAAPTYGPTYVQGRNNFINAIISQWSSLFGHSYDEPPSASMMKFAQIAIPQAYFTADLRLSFDAYQYGSSFSLHDDWFQFRFNQSPNPKKIHYHIEYMPVDPDGASIGPWTSMGIKSWTAPPNTIKSPIFHLDPVALNSGIDANYRAAPLSIEILDKDKQVVNKLKVGKMVETGVLSGSEPSVTLDIDKDSDRFYVRIPGGASMGAVSIKVATVENPDASYNDDETEIDMQVDGDDLITKSMLLVSDDVDDDHQVDGITDDAPNDRTHKIQLDGKFQVKSIKISGTEYQADIKTPVKVIKKIACDVFVLKVNGAAVRTTPDIESDMKIIKERYAQVGVKFEYTIAERDQPNGVDLSDGLTTRSGSNLEALASTVLASEVKSLINGLGTVGAAKDIQFFYVNRINIGTDETPLNPSGEAFNDFWNDESEEDYIYNVVIGASYTPYAPFTPGHEFGHLLTDAGHHNKDTNLMIDGTSTTNTLGATKRLDSDQETKIHSSDRLSEP